MAHSSAPNPFATIHEGEIVANRYVVEAVLGSGGMGQVFRAADRELNDERVALKVLHPYLASEEQVFNRFRNEVLVARSLSHPNIVRTHDLGRAPEGFYYISMEYVEGESLKERLLREKQLSLSAALSTLQEIFAGVSHAHHRGIIHRDLKPANILLTKNGEVRLADFGTARLLTGQMALTGTGQVIGTASYMSPEQIRAEELDVRCDIYALGIIAFELVAGRRPFDGTDYVSTAFKQLNEPLPSFAKERGLPRWYEDACRRACEKKREDRFANVEELAAAFCGPQTGPAKSPRGTRSRFDGTSPESQRASKAAPLLFVALLLGVVAGGSWWRAREVAPQRESHRSGEVKEAANTQTALPSSPLPSAGEQSPMGSSDSRPTPELPKASPPPPVQIPSPAPQAVAQESPPRPSLREKEVGIETRGEAGRGNEEPHLPTANADIIFRLSGADPAQSFLSGEVENIRWIAAIRGVVRNEATAGRDFRASLTPEDAPAATMSLKLSLLSLGTDANPEVRLGGNLRDLRSRDLKSGRYRLDLFFQGRPAGSATFTLR